MSARANVTPSHITEDSEVKSFRVLPRELIRIGRGGGGGGATFEKQCGRRRVGADADWRESAENPRVFFCSPPVSSASFPRLGSETGKAESPGFHLAAPFGAGARV